MLTEAEVKALLAESGLHGAAQKRLATAQYADAAALTVAIEAEKTYLKEVEVSPEDIGAIKGMLDKASAALATLTGAAPAAVPAAAVPAAAAAKVPAVEVAAELDRHNLPPASRARLSEAEYATAEEVKTAALAEIDYIKTVTGSGKPFTRKSAAEATERPLAERAAVQDSILNQTFGQNRPARK